MYDNQIAIEDLIKHTGNSIYKLSILLGQRALQIAEGNRDLLSETKDETPISVALNEMHEGKIKFRKTKTS